MVFEVIAPPTVGPTTLEDAKTAPTSPDTIPNRAGGTTSKMVTKTMENIPEPPRPWKARNMILALVSRSAAKTSARGTLPRLFDLQLRHRLRHSAEDGKEGEHR